MRKEKSIAFYENNRTLNVSIKTIPIGYKIGYLCIRTYYQCVLVS